MLDAPLNLRRTGGVIGAEDGRLALGTHERRSTLGATRDEAYLLAHHEGACVEVHGSNLGDNLTALLYEYHISDVEVEVVHKVGIVQCGTLDHGARKLYGFEVGHGCHRTCASHLIGHFAEACERLFGLKLIRNGPSGYLGGIAQCALLCQGIDLDDDAVGGYGQILALGIPVADILEHLVEGGALAHRGRHLESPLGSFLQALVVSLAGERLT